MPHISLPDEIPDEDDHRPVPSFSREDLEEAAALNREGRTAEGWAVLGGQGDRYADSAKDFVELDEFLEERLGPAFGTREDHQAHLDNYISLAYEREVDGRFLAPVEYEVIDSYRSLKDSFAVPERIDRLGLSWNPAIGLTGMHSERRGDGSGRYSKFSLQHDLGRDGHGNDDTTQNLGRTPASDALAYGGGEYGGGGAPPSTISQEQANQMSGPEFGFEVAPPSPTPEPQQDPTDEPEGDDSATPAPSPTPEPQQDPTNASVSGSIKTYDEL